MYIDGKRVDHEQGSAVKGQGYIEMDMLEIGHRKTLFSEWVSKLTF
jgi:hypothetical protein